MGGVLQVSRGQERNGDVRGGGATSRRAFEGGQHAEGRELPGEPLPLGRRPSVVLWLMVDRAVVDSVLCYG